MRAISLFAGGGGFEIGFDRAGIQTVLQAESDPWCLEVLARHWPDVERVTDVRNVGHRGEPACRNASDEIRPSVEGRRRQTEAGLSSDIDLVYGGWPCQDLSVAGNRAGLRGERSGLFYEFARVVRELRPRWLAAENVPGLLSSAAGADFGSVLRTLVDLGYGVAWRVLDGRWFGVPQRRRRVLIVGCLGDARRAAQVLAVCESCGGHPAPRRETGQAVAYSLAASVRGTGDGHGNAWNTAYLAATQSGGGHPGSNLPGRHHEDDENLIIAGSGVDPESMRPLTARSTGYRMDYESENFVVAADLRNGSTDEQSAMSLQGGGMGQGRGRSINSIPHMVAGAQRASEGVRRLTPLECERLQGWPDDWTKYTADGREIPDSHRYRICGNGIIATVAEWLGYRLMRAHSFEPEVAA